MATTAVVVSRRSPPAIPHRYARPHVPSGRRDERAPDLVLASWARTVGSGRTVVRGERGARTWESWSNATVITSPSLVHRAAPGDRYEVRARPLLKIGRASCRERV